MNEAQFEPAIIGLSILLIFMICYIFYPRKKQKIKKMNEGKLVFDIKYTVGKEHKERHKITTNQKVVIKILDRLVERGKDYDIKVTLK